MIALFEFGMCLHLKQFSKFYFILFQEPIFEFFELFRMLRVHDGPVTGLSLHATGDYILSTSTDQHWAFSDIRTGKLITKVTDGENGSGTALTCAQFHPDGLIFGTGTSDAMIKIWDLKEVRKKNLVLKK